MSTLPDEPRLPTVAGVASPASRRIVDRLALVAAGLALVAGLASRTELATRALREDWLEVPPTA